MIGGDNLMNRILVVVRVHVQMIGDDKLMNKILVVVRVQMIRGDNHFNCSLVVIRVLMMGGDNHIHRTLVSDPGKYYSRGRVLIRGGKTTRPTNKGVDSHTVSQTFPYNSADVDDDDEFYDDHTEENDEDDVDATLRESPLKSPASDSPANSQRFHPRDSPPDSRHYSPHNSRLDSQRDSNYRDGTHDISQRPPISRLGEGFGSYKVVRNIIGILKEHLEGSCDNCHFWIIFVQLNSKVCDINMCFE